jgi:hypothetical protein
MAGSFLLLLCKNRKGDPCHKENSLMFCRNPEHLQQVFYTNTSAQKMVPTCISVPPMPLGYEKN